MPPREVLVTYTLYPSGNGDLRAAVKAIDAQLPLRNLHWKSSTRTSLRTIQEANVRLVELSDVPPTKDHIAGSVLEAPLVHLCLVACDDSDIYKNNTRSFIKDWLSLLSSRRTVHAPLIVLVNPPSTSGAAVSTKNVFGRDRGIIAKLKADFNTTKRDICAQLNLPPVGTNDPAVWPELINKLKESVILAFDGAVLEREDEVKRGETQRVTVGWNFCNWFLLKESLANSFEGVNLCEDALIVYEELEAAFLQVLKEQNLSWFGKLGGTGPDDDRLPVLDTSAKPYRDLLLSSTISVFDFRIYVFARQCILLGKLGRITEIAKRGQWFVASLARRLRECEADLAEHFIESWTYTACMDLVTKCDEWSRIDRPNNDYSGLIAYESARAELLDIARMQVERIGVDAGHLPNVYPFQAVTSVLPPSDDGVLFESSDASASDAGAGEHDAPAPRAPLSNRIFIDALADGSTFRELYSGLTKKALAAYEACGKVNSAIRLKVDLVALSIHDNDKASTYDLSRLLARDCAELHVWDRVARYALESALVAHTELQRERDEDWTNLALAYVRVCAVSPSDDFTSLHSVLAGIKDLPRGRQVLSQPTFHIRLLDEIASMSTDVSVTTFSIEVNNALPIPVIVDDVQLEFTSEKFGSVAYASGPIELRPGKQTLTVTCSTSIAGMISLQETRVVIGHIVFAAPLGVGQVKATVHRNLQGIRTVFRMPYSLALDDDPRVVLEIHSGKQAIKNVRAVLSSLLNEVGYHLDRAHADREVELSHLAAGLGDMDSNDVVELSIPYSGIPLGELAKVQVVVQYETASGLVRSYIDEHSVFMGLPLTVNVQDFFRPNLILSSFSIASDGREYLRVGSVQLHSSSEYNIEACRKIWDSTASVTPNEPLSCLFKVFPASEPKDVARPGNEGVLRLTIEYRTVEEEVDMIAQAALAHLDTPCAALLRAVRARLSDRTPWLQLYILTGETSYVFDSTWVEAQDRVPRDTMEVFLSSLDTAFATRWRTLEIPVDIPQRRLLTTVQIIPVVPDAIVYEGRALAFNVKVSTSLAWAGPDAATRPPPSVVFDIQPNPEDWLVVGQKRKVYDADPAHDQEFEIVLVPMRPGRLFPPHVSVQLAAGATGTAATDSGAGDGGMDSGRGSAAGGERQSLLLCETYVANAAQSVHVLPVRTSMTALVPVAPGWETGP